MQHRVHALERTLHAEVPLTRQMGVRVEEHDGRELLVKADFAPNVNIHGTAFGGSLFSICAVTCWGLLHLKIEEAGIDARAVLARAEVAFPRAVTGEILCRCRAPEDGSLERFLNQAAASERARIALHAEIIAGGETAVRFDGRYAAYYP